MAIRLLEEYEYQYYFISIEPFALVAPFGLYWEFEPKQKTRVITCEGNEECFENPFYETRINNNVHAKLAVGSRGAIFGSWNWSLLHPKATKHRELVLFVEPQESLYKQLLNWFERRWFKSKVEIVNDARN